MRLMNSVNKYNILQNKFLYINIFTEISFRFIKKCFWNEQRSVKRLLPSIILHYLFLRFSKHTYSLQHKNEECIKLKIVMLNTLIE